VETYALVTEDGIEGRIARLVGDKQALFTGLFDGTSDAVVFERAGTFLSRLETLVTAPEQAGRLEGEAEPVDDRSDDEPAIDEEAGVDGEVVAVAPAPAGSVAALFGQIQMTRLADGRVSLEAPAPAAAALAELFQGMARLLAFGDQRA
jgi:hypothetical protein